MQKISDSTSTANGAGEYISGSPGTGVDATVITVEWLNTIQRELVNLVIGAGLSLDPADYSQVLKAIQAIQSAASTWAKLSGKPTTIADFGITDAYTKAQVDAAKAPLSSPAFTGTPIGPTAVAGTDSFQLATTAFVRTAIASLVDSSPAALDTLAELAAALGNDPNFATTITNALAAKATKATDLAGYGILNAYSKTDVDSALAAITRQATEAILGMAKVATQALVDAGSDDLSIITSKKLRSAKSTCSAWVSWNGTGAVVVRDSYNVSSITDNGTGDFTVNFATPMASANYSFTYTVGGVGNVMNMASGALAAPTVSALRVTSVSAAGNGTGANFQMTDFPVNNIQIFGGK